MRAYKVLSDGRSRFTGWRWPLPDGGRPGDWVHAGAGPLALCANGVHACTVAQLPQWLGDELWVAELDGQIVRAEPAVIAQRARLLEPVGVWDTAAHHAFGVACVERAETGRGGGPSAGIMLETIRRLSGLGLAAPVGYWAAVLAGERAGGARRGPVYDAGFAHEREAQARWLRFELGLAD